MSMSLDRRRGSDRGVGVSNRRRIPVEAHEGTPLDFQARLMRAAREAAHGIGTERFREKIAEWASDERLLWVAYRQLAQYGGQAPGIDGQTYDDLPEILLRGELRRLRDELRSATYQPQRLRRVLIPKLDSDQLRELLLPTIYDRIIGKAIAMAIGPYLDELLGEGCFAYRPQRGPLSAVAHAMHQADRGGKYVWLNVDLKDAFARVPRPRLLDLLRSHLGNESLINVIGMLINNGRARGIPMGQPLCPPLFNLYADKFIDQALRRLLPDVVHVRFADNSLLLQRTLHEARRTLETLRHTLRPTGLKLKSGWQVEDVRTGKPVNFVGVQIDKHQGQWNLRLAESNWRRLRLDLTLAHRGPMAPLTVRDIIKGWMDQRGFLTPDGSEREVINRIHQTAADEGFLELPSNESLSRSIQRSRRHWSRTLHAELQIIERPVPAGGSASPPFSLSRRAGRAGAIGSAPPAGSFILSTDGSSFGPGCAGGWAFVLRHADGRPIGLDSGGYLQTTSNQMEITAVLIGLRQLPDRSAVLVRSDSRYVVDNVQSHIRRWMDSGVLWTRPGARPEIANADLWLALADELNRLDTEFVWVQGHSGDPDNEACDHLSRLAAYRVAVERNRGG